MWKKVEQFKEENSECWTLTIDNMYVHQDVTKCNTTDRKDAIKFETYEKALYYKENVFEFIPNVKISRR